MTALDLSSHKGSSALAQDSYFGLGSPVVDAAEAGNLAELESLFLQGFSPDDEGDFGVTALMRAAYHGSVPIMEFLITSGARVNATDIGGATPLHLASRQGNTEAVSLLLNNNALINATDKEGWTPLMRATMADYKDVSAILLTNGANPLIENSQGETVLQHAAMIGNTTILEMIFKTESPNKFTTKQQQKALALAQRRGHSDASLLLQNASKADKISTDAAVTSQPLPALENKRRMGSTKESATSKSSDKVLDSPQQSSPSNLSKSEPIKTLPSISPPPRSLQKKGAASTSHAFLPTPILKPSSFRKSNASEKESTPQNQAKLDEGTSPLSLLPSAEDNTVNVLNQAPPTNSNAHTQQLNKKGPPIIPQSTGKVLYFLQLGAFSEPNVAEEAWKRAQQEHPDVLGPLKSHVVESFLASSRRFVYRLRAGAFTKESAANKSCAKLRDRSIDCFVVETEEKPAYLAAREAGQSHFYQDLINKEIELDQRKLARYESQPETAPSAPSRTPAPLEPSREPKFSDLSMADLADEADKAYEAASKAPSASVPPAAYTAKQAIPLLSNTAPTPPEQPTSLKEAPRSLAAKNTPKNTIPTPVRSPLTLGREAFVPSATPSPASEERLEDFYKQLKKEPNLPEVYEAVLVPDESYFNSQKAAIRNNPPSLFIGPFATPTEANDYWDRMFAYDQTFQNLPHQAIQPTSERPAALRISPATASLANAMCPIVAASGKQCRPQNITPPSTARTNTTLSRSVSNNTPEPTLATRPSIDRTQFWINMGSFAQQSEAEYYWSFLSEDHRDVMNGLNYDLEEVDVPALGPNASKLKIGPFFDSNRAGQLCRIFKVRSIACLVEKND